MFKLLKIGLTLLISSGFYIGKSQNLISNGSFENLIMPINWSSWGGGFFDNSVFPEQQIVSDWTVFNSPDYFTADYPYANQLYWQPTNWFGNSVTKTGKSYAGISLFNKAGSTKEYISQQLTLSLQHDTVYCLSFYTTRADRMPYAIKNLGALFSVNSPTMVNNYISANPQVVNVSGFITDTISWVEIQGCFTAQGGEQYITIGNFNSNANTDTLRIPSTNPLTGTGTDVAYYYIDSVTLWQNNFPTAINEIGKEKGFSLYPNPTLGKLKLLCQNLKDIEHCVVKITDVLGREVKQLKFEEEIDITELEKGIYFLSVYKSKTLIGTKKIVRE
ncbi:MAG: T9SS type A sorting domain-containing protein [Bacteroidia bacterium]